MLMLGVNEGDYIMIGDDIKIRFSKISTIHTKCTVGIEAPVDKLILRKELHEASTGVAEKPYDHRAHEAAKRAAKKAEKL